MGVKVRRTPEWQDSGALQGSWSHESNVSPSTGQSTPPLLLRAPVHTLDMPHTLTPMIKQMGTSDLRAL